MTGIDPCAPMQQIGAMPDGADDAAELNGCPTTSSR
jgi:hypothetical protein